MFEHDFLDWLKRTTPSRPGIELGIGDDAAILSPTANRTTLTTDLLMEGVHFESAAVDWQWIGRKALGVSLSDTAAMGAMPQAAVLNLTLPRTARFEQAQQLYLGVLELAAEQSVALVGGDTNRWDGGLVVGSCVVGQLTHPGWRMDGAQPGDHILVSGPLGGSLLGKHLRFKPRCDLVRKLAGQVDIHAATDITDSLTLDLQEICDQSRVGAQLIAGQIPIAEAAREMAHGSGRTPWEHALFDGEDFELLLVVDSATAKSLLANASGGLPLWDIGVMTDQPGLTLSHRPGEFEPLVAQGYEH